MKEILFVLLEEYAEYESSNLAAVINSSNKFKVKTVSLENDLVGSIGGFYTKVDYTIEEALSSDFAGVILVGGMSWRKAESKKVLMLVEKAIEKETVIGAICDATAFLAMHGYLNDIAHTGNGLESLRSYAKDNYTGESKFIESQAVKCGNIVTANGTAALEFAKAILELLDVMPIDEINEWYNNYKLGYIEASKL